METTRKTQSPAGRVFSAVGGRTLKDRYMVSVAAFLRREKRHCLLLLFALILMGIGCFIYIIFRTGNYRFLLWLGINRRLLPLDMFPKNSICVFLVYSMPGGLRLLSGLLLTGLIWRRSAKRFLLYASTIAVLALTHEFLPRTSLLSGVFDPLDAVVLVCSYIAGVCLYFLLIGKKLRGSKSAAF
jgi:hypothetical protein